MKMRSIIIAVVLAILGIAMAVTQAYPAQPPICMPAAAMHKMLTSLHKEVVVSRGMIGSEGAAIVVYVAPPPGSKWTMVVMGIDGSACMLAAGSLFKQMRQPPPGGDPA